MKALDTSNTIFHFSKVNDVVSVDQLLSSESDAEILYKLVNGRNEGNGLTALHYAATYNSIEVALKLLQHGAYDSLFLPDYESGWTPLHRSLYFGNFKLSVILIKAGGKLTSENASDDWKVAVHPNKDRQRSIKNISSWRVGIDHDGFTPLDLLSETLKHHLSDSKKGKNCTSVVAFGKSDITLGVALPNSSTDVLRPKRVEELAGESIVQLSAGKFHSLAVSKDGNLYSWGHGRHGKLGHGDELSQPLPLKVLALIGQRVKTVATADSHVLVVTEYGALFSWGSDTFGQLGHGNTASGKSFLSSPTKVNYFKRMNVVGVAAGESHSVCFSSDGEVYSWGSNKSGQLGVSDIKVSTSIPTRVKTDVFAIQVSASYSGSLLLGNNMSQSLTKKSRVKTNDVLQWGNGIRYPKKVLFASQNKRYDAETCPSSICSGENRIINITQISSGKFHNVAVSFQGYLYTWGLHVDQLGHGADDTKPVISNPTLLESLMPENGGGRIVYTCASSNRTCAISDVGDLFVWGSTQETGVLGPNNGKYQPVPKRVVGVKQAISAGVGEDHTLVLTCQNVPPLPHCDLVAPPFSVNIMSKEAREDESDDENIHEICVDISVCDDQKSPTIWSHVPSLHQLCERQLSVLVDSRNVISVLAAAESYNAHSLVRFCSSFIQRNFDAILVQNRPADLDSLLDGLECYTENCRAIVSRSNSFSIRQSDDDVHSGSGRERGGSFSKPNQRSNSITDSEKPNCRRKASGSFSETDRYESPGIRKNVERSLSIEIDLTSAECVYKRIRAIKKKLSSVNNMQKKVDSDGSIGEIPLSKEQMEKISRKNALEKEMNMLQLILPRLKSEEKIKSAAVALRKMDFSESSGTEVQESGTKTIPKPTKMATNSKSVTSSRMVTGGPPPSLSEWTKMISKQNMQMGLSENVVGSSPVHVTPTCKTWATELPQTPKMSLKSIQEQQVTPSSSSSPCTPSPMTSVEKNSSHKKGSTSGISAAASPAGLSLEAFLISPKTRNTSLPPQSKPLSAWNDTHKSFTNEKNTQQKKSFREIQMEEEMERPKVQYSDGNTNPWYIDRRPRADSLDEVIREQLYEKEKSEEEEGKCRKERKITRK